MPTTMVLTLKEIIQKHGVIVLTLIEIVLLFRDSILIAEELRLDAVHLRVHLHHLDGVLLHHDGNRKKDNLRDKRKDHNGPPVIPGEPVAEVKNNAEKAA